MKQYKYNFGKYKMWITRLTSYLAPLNFIMLIYLSLILEEPFGIKKELWIVILCIVIPSILWFDVKYVFPQAQDYAISKTPEWMRMLEQIERIETLLMEGKEDG